MGPEPSEDQILGPRPEPESEESMSGSGGGSHWARAKLWDSRTLTGRHPMSDTPEDSDKS